MKKIKLIEEKIQGGEMIRMIRYMKLDQTNQNMEVALKMMRNIIQMLVTVFGEMRMAQIKKNIGLETAKHPGEILLGEETGDLTQEVVEILAEAIVDILREEVQVGIPKEVVGIVKEEAIVDILKEEVQAETHKEEITDIQREIVILAGWKT